MEYRVPPTTPRSVVVQTSSFLLPKRRGDSTKGIPRKSQGMGVCVTSTAEPVLDQCPSWVDGRRGLRPVHLESSRLYSRVGVGGSLSLFRRRGRLDRGFPWCDVPSALLHPVPVGVQQWVLVPGGGHLLYGGGVPGDTYFSTGTLPPPRCHGLRPPPVSPALPSLPRVGTEEGVHVRTSGRTDGWGRGRRDTSGGRRRLDKQVGVEGRRVDCDTCRPVFSGPHSPVSQWSLLYPLGPPVVFVL